MPSYLDRYLAGEHEQVWDELMALGAAVRDEPLYTDALAVARETMRRVRQNIETLIQRLQLIGYKLYDTTDFGNEPAFTPPPDDAVELLDELETDIGGPLPISLRTWYEVVGSVSLLGKHPDWHPEQYSVYRTDSQLTKEPEYRVETLAGKAVDRRPLLHMSREDTWSAYREEVYTDALVVVPLESAIDGSWIAAIQNGLHLFNFAPDEFFKVGQSSGSLYGIIIPNSSADGLVAVEPHYITFVNYLRICFRWGGFPGFERYHKNVPYDTIAELASGLLPI